LRTVSQLSTLLSEYIKPGGTPTFISRLNQVLDRLYQMGDWKELQAEFEADVSAGYIVLPPDYESILGARVQDMPVPVHSTSYEYQDRGPGYLERPVGGVYGLIDKGWVSLLSDLPEDGLDNLTFTLVRGAFQSGDNITVLYTTTEHGEVLSSNNLTSGTTLTITPQSNITDIGAISFSSLPARVVASSEDVDGNDIIYAILPPGDGAARYHRYEVPQVPESTEEEWVLHVLCKRAFHPLAGNDDLVYLDNIHALKHGLLAVLAEDESDLDRAQVHWELAKKTLSEGLHEARGGAVGYPQVHVWGRGISALAGYY